jgi:imidazole glycerol phosphate synthase glutamine amidotransferase subunit
MTDLVIVPTGTANLASVVAAFQRLGVEPQVSAAPGRVRAASHVMLPGVGTFGASMRRLRESGADRALAERIAGDRPTIAICVGHQLLFASSDESPGEQGLGIVRAHVGRFPDGVRVPQFGWNAVRADDACAVLKNGYAYFANSYRATEAAGWRLATATHGGPYIAAMERGNVVGCQFHPELSGAYGAALLGRWLELRC